MQCLVGGMQPCSNFADVFAGTSECLTRTSCLDFETCLNAVPTCRGTTGAAGAVGATGAAGATGATGSDACTSLCTRAESCCMAISPTSNCGVFVESCSSANASQDTMACQSILAAARDVPSVAASCQ